MPKHDYPLHPGQAQPYYTTIPVEEYERIMNESQMLKDTLKRHGIEVPRSEP